MAAPIDAPYSGKINLTNSILGDVTVSHGTSFPSTFEVGRMFLRTDEGVLYFNSGTEGTPVWSNISQPSYEYHTMPVAGSGNLTGPTVDNYYKFGAGGQIWKCTDDGSTDSPTTYTALQDSNIGCWAENFGSYANATQFDTAYTGRDGTYLNFVGGGDPTSAILELHNNGTASTDETLHYDLGHTLDQLKSYEFGVLARVVFSAGSDTDNTYCHFGISDVAVTDASTSCDFVGFEWDMDNTTNVFKAVTGDPDNISSAGDLVQFDGVTITSGQYYWFVLRMMPNWNSDIGSGVEAQYRAMCYNAGSGNATPSGQSLTQDVDVITDFTRGMNQSLRYFYFGTFNTNTATSRTQDMDIYSWYLLEQDATLLVI